LLPATQSQLLKLDTASA